MTSRREIPLSVYMQGGADRGTRRIYFCVCGVCVGMCGCEKIMRPGAEVRPLVRFRPVPQWSARDAFRETHG